MSYRSSRISSKHENTVRFPLRPWPFSSSFVDNVRRRRIVAQRGCLPSLRSLFSPKEAQSSDDLFFSFLLPSSIPLLSLASASCFWFSSISIPLQLCHSISRTLPLNYLSLLINSPSSNSHQLRGSLVDSSSSSSHQAKKYLSSPSRGPPQRSQ